MMVVTMVMKVIDSNFINEEDKTEVENYGCTGDEDDNNFVTEEDKNEVEEDDDEVKARMFFLGRFKKCAGPGVGKGSSRKKNKNVFDHFGIELFSSG
nr:B3 domain-containing protein At5g60140-like [Ipomoea batatas]